MAFPAGSVGASPADVVFGSNDGVLNNNIFGFSGDLDEFHNDPPFFSEMKNETMGIISIFRTGM